MYQVRPEILDGLQLPAELDREVVIDTILLETAELGLVYTKPGLLAAMISTWSRRKLPIWERLCETLHYEYNPIHNYDRHEARRLDINRKAEGSGTGTSTNDSYRAGYDSGNMVHSEKETGNGSSSNHSNEDVEEDETLHAYGNIGVTTTQQMITDQRELVRYDVIEEIVSDFKSAFCILVY